MSRRIRRPRKKAVKLKAEVVKQREGDELEVIIMVSAPKGVTVKVRTEERGEDDTGH